MLYCELLPGAEISGITSLPISRLRITGWAMGPKRKRDTSKGAPPARGLHKHNQCTQPCTISGMLPKEPLATWDPKEENKAYVQDLVLCPSMVRPFEPLPLELRGKLRGCKFSELEASFSDCFPCQVCVERHDADGRRPGKLFFTREPLVLVDASCLCHGVPESAGHAQVSNAEVQTDIVEFTSVAVQVDEEELCMQVSESEGGEPPHGAVQPGAPADAQVNEVKVKISQSKLRKERRRKLQESKSSAPLLPFPPRQ